MSKFPEIKIGDLCQLVNGKAFKPSDWTPSGLPIVRIQNLNDESKPFNYYSGEVKEKFFINSGELLFSWSGTPGTSFGAFFWERGKAVLNQHIFKVLCKAETVDKFYFRYALNYRLDRIIDQSHGGVGLKHITKGRLESTTVPLPPLAEQKRIAAILDKADELRRLEQESLRLTDELLKSTFLEVFGDPVTNPKGWPLIKLERVVSSIDSGWSPKCESFPAPEGKWGVLKLGAVTWGIFNDKENKCLPNGVEPRPELETTVGDLLFCRKNTYELVGNSSFVHKTQSKLMMSDLIFRLNLTKEMNNAFLWQVLQQKSTQFKLRSLAGGTSGSMPNISKSRLKTLVVPQPPIEIQVRFRKIVEEHFTQRQSQLDAINLQHSLFNSLVQRAFRGEMSNPQTAEKQLKLFKEKANT